MPRYFFHTHIGPDVVLDPDGRALSDPDAAYQAARTLALQLLQGADADPALLTAILVVIDEAETTVLEFPLTEALVAEPLDRPEIATKH